MEVWFYFVWSGMAWLQEGFSFSFLGTTYFVQYQTLGLCYYPENLPGDPGEHLIAAYSLTMLAWIQHTFIHFHISYGAIKNGDG